MQACVSQCFMMGFDAFEGVFWVDLLVNSNFASLSSAAVICLKL